MARADHGMGEKKGHQTVARGNPDEDVGQDTLAEDIQGRNALQGKDQEQFRNQRQDQPDSTTETEGVVESFKKPRPERATGDGKKKD